MPEEDFHLPDGVRFQAHFWNAVGVLALWVSNAAGVLFAPTHRSKNLPQNRIGGDT